MEGGTVLLPQDIYWVSQVWVPLVFGIAIVLGLASVQNQSWTSQLGYVLAGLWSFKFWYGFHVWNQVESDLYIFYVQTIFLTI